MTDLLIEAYKSSGKKRLCVHSRKRRNDASREWRQRNKPPFVWPSKCKTRISSKTKPSVKGY